MRGIPFSVREGEIAEFFQGLKIQRDGIHIVRTPDGRLTGEAYVEFTSHEDIVAAQRKNKERIGSRYIELFTSTVDVSARRKKKYFLSVSRSELGGLNVFPPFFFLYVARAWVPSFFLKKKKKHMRVVVVVASGGSRARYRCGIVMGRKWKMGSVGRLRVVSMVWDDTMAVVQRRAVFHPLFNTKRRLLSFEGGHNGGHSGGFQPFAGPPPPQAYGYGAPPPMHQRYAPPPQPDYYNVRPPIARSAPPPQQAYAQPGK